MGSRDSFMLSASLSNITEGDVQTISVRVYGKHIVNCWRSPHRVLILREAPALSRFAKFKHRFNSSLHVHRGHCYYLQHGQCLVKTHDVLGIGSMTIHLSIDYRSRF